MAPTATATKPRAPTASAAKKNTTKAAPAKKVVEKEAAPAKAKAASTKPAAKQPKEKAAAPADGEKKQRQRRVVNKESVDANFTELQEQITAEIEKNRENKDKVKGSNRLLQSILKKIKTLQLDTTRVIRIRPKSNRPRNVNSGFMKPVKVSTDMAQFAGWSQGELHSRVEATSKICEHVAKNNLNNPKDRREIIPDAKLTALLQKCPAYADIGDTPLTFFRLQKYLQVHFSSSDLPANQVPETPAP